MKKNLLFAVCILSLALPARAMVTPEESVSNDYIQKQGYSSEMAKYIDIRCAQAAAKTPDIDDTEADFHQKYNWVRKFWIYMDPTLDDGSFMRHEYHVNPNVHDL